ncbi:glucose-1-phosphate adenylyltransferase subunit GlgD [Sporolactobacillus terrae]
MIKLRNQKICGIINLSDSMETSRLLTVSKPLAALPFCGSYRLIDFPLSNLTAAGSESIGIFMNEQYRSIYNHVRSGSDWDLDGISGDLFFFAPGIDQSRYGQNHEDLVNYYDNLEFVEKSDSDYVVVLGAQVLCNIDLRALLQNHLEQKAAITVVYKTARRSEGESLPIVELDMSKNGRIKGMVSEETLDKKRVPINMEIYCMKASLFIKVVRCSVARNEVYYLREALHQAVAEFSTYGFEYTGYMKKIQSIKAYYDANMDMLKDANRIALLGGSHQIGTKMKNEVPAYYGPKAAPYHALIGEGCRVNGCIRHSIVNRNVSVYEGTNLEDSIILEDCIIGENVYLKHVIVGQGTYVKPNTRITGRADQPFVLEKKQTPHRIP